MIFSKKFVVKVGEASIVPDGEEIPLSVPTVINLPTVVIDTLWLPYLDYIKMRDFILSRENDILEDVEDFGSLFSVLQWVNRAENDLRSSCQKIEEVEA